MTFRHLFLSILSVLIGIPTALAGNGGFRDVTTAPPMYFTNIYLAANTSLTLATTNLSAGSDTVLHVQDMSTGAPIGGNDDCYDWDWSSCLTVSATSFDRQLAIIVRAYGETVGGNAKLSVQMGTGSPVLWGSFDFGVHFESIGSLASGANIYTTRRQKMATDTVLLVFSSPQSYEMAIDYADDGGGGNMSLIASLNAPTTGWVAVGSYNTSYGGLKELRDGYRLLWDDEVHIYDADGDGLGAGLEAALGTSSSTADSDGDGIPDGRDTDNDGINDGLEVKSYDYGSSAIELPTWGADPKVKDIFIEADWWDKGGGSDANQMTSDIANQIRNIYWGPTSGGAQPSNDERVRVHLDIGRENPAAAGSIDLTYWGKWGGASRVPSNTDCPTDSRKAGRSMFHQMYVQDSTLGSAYEGHWCARVENRRNVAAHELGHNIAMGSHSGMPATGPGNYKAVYPSIMNYLYQDAADFFSVATFRGLSFNPTAMSELNWKGSNTTADIALLARANGYATSGNSVDWNQDGKFQSSNVGAFINPKGATSRMREWGWVDPSGPHGLGDGRGDPTLAWYRTPAGNRLYIFYRDISAGISQPGALKYRYSTDVLSSCAGSVTPDNVTKCATFSQEKTVTGSVNAIGAPSVVEYINGSTRKLLITYLESSTRWNFQSLTVNSSGTETFSTPKATAWSSVNYAGAMTSAYNGTAGTVDIYYVNSGTLNRATYTVSSDTLGGINVAQTWSTGGNVSTNGGVGLAWGYLKGNSTQYLFAAVPASTTGNDLVLARKTNTNTWEKVSTSSIRTDIRPGLAYKNMPDSSGRFMVFARDPREGFGNSQVLAWTEGNDSSTSATVQRLSSWKKVLSHGQEDTAVSGAATLIFDPTLDTSVRGAFTHGAGGGSVWFQGLIDGGVNTTFKDQNDYNMMKKNLKARFTGAYKACYALDSSGNCTSWR